MGASSSSNARQKNVFTRAIGSGGVGFFNGGGEEEEKKLKISAMNEYSSSMSAKIKEDLLKRFAKAMKEAGIQVNPDDSHDAIRKALDDNIPHPDKNGKKFSDLPDKQVKLCKLLAEVLNNEFTPGVTDPSEKFIDTSFSPAEVCRIVSEYINSFISGITVELTAVSTTIKNSVTEIELLNTLAKTALSDLSAVITANNNPELVRDTAKLKEILSRILNEITKKQKIMENYLHINVLPANKLIETAMKEHSKMHKLVQDIFQDYPINNKLYINSKDSNDFSKNISTAISTALHGISSTAALSNKIHKALKEVGLTIDDYLNMKDINELLDKSDKLYNTLSNVESLGKSISAYNELKRQFKHFHSDKAARDELKSVDGAGERKDRCKCKCEKCNSRGCKETSCSCINGGGGEYDPFHSDEKTGGAVEIYGQSTIKKKSEYAKKKETYMAEKKLIIKDFTEKLHRHYGKLNDAINSLTDDLGSKIPITEKTDHLRDVFKLMGENKMKRTEEALMGFYLDANARMHKEKYVNNLVSISKACSEVIESDTYKSCSEYFIKIRDITEEIRKIIDYFSDVVVKKYGSGADDGELIEGGADDEHKSAPLHFNNFGEIVNNFVYKYYTATVLSRIKDSSKEVTDYAEKYEKVVGDAINQRIFALEEQYAKRFKALEEGYNAACAVPAVAPFPFNKFLTRLAVDPNGEYTVGNRDSEFTEIKKQMRQEFDVKKNFYKVLEAIEQYLRIFSINISKDPEAMKDIKKMLDSTSLISNWFNEDTGNYLFKAFDLMPNSRCGFSPNVNDYSRNGLSVPNYDNTIEHYYTKLDDGTNGGALQPTKSKAGVGIPFWGIPVSGTDTAKERFTKLQTNINSSLDTYQSLKNLINIFVRIGDKINGVEIHEQIFMSPTQIYKGLMEYIKLSTLSINDGTIHKYEQAAGGVRQTPTTLSVNYLKGAVDIPALPFYLTGNENGLHEIPAPTVFNAIPMTADWTQYPVLNIYNTNLAEINKRLYRYMNGIHNCIQLNHIAAYNSINANNNLLDLASVTYLMSADPEATYDAEVITCTGLVDAAVVLAAGIVGPGNLTQHLIVLEAIRLNYPGESVLGTPLTTGDILVAELYKLFRLIKANYIIVNPQNNPIFAVVPYSIRFGMVGHHSAEPDDNYNKIGDNFETENRYFGVSIKAIAGKILTALGLYDITGSDASQNAIIGTRIIVGGGRNSVKDRYRGSSDNSAITVVIEKASELYFRLPRLAEFYQDILKYDITGSEQISMIPDLDGIFSGFIRIVFANNSKSVDLSEYTNSELHNLITEMNLIYTHFYKENGEDCCRQAILAFVAEINRRYGLVKQTDYQSYSDIIREARSSANGLYTRSIYEDNIAILNDEEIDDSTSSRKAPSEVWRQRYLPEGLSITQEATNPFDEGKFDDLVTQNQTNTRRLIQDFQSKVYNKMLDGYKKSNKISYSIIIKQIQMDMTRAVDAEQKLNNACKLIRRVDSIATDNIKTFMFHETVTTGLNTLSGIEKTLQHFKRQMNLLNATNIENYIMDALWRRWKRSDAGGAIKEYNTLQNPIGPGADIVNYGEFIDVLRSQNASDSTSDKMSALRNALGYGSNNNDPTRYRTDWIERYIYRDTVAPAPYYGRNGINLNVGSARVLALLQAVDAYYNNVGNNARIGAQGMSDALASDNNQGITQKAPSTYTNAALNGISRQNARFLLLVRLFARLFINYERIMEDYVETVFGLMSSTNGLVNININDIDRNVRLNFSNLRYVSIDIMNSVKKYIEILRPYIPKEVLLRYEEDISITSSAPYLEKELIDHYFNLEYNTNGVQRDLTKRNGIDELADATTKALQSLVGSKNISVDAVTHNSLNDVGSVNQIYIIDGADPPFNNEPSDNFGRFETYGQVFSKIIFYNSVNAANNIDTASLNETNSFELANRIIRARPQRLLPNTPTPLIDIRLTDDQRAGVITAVGTALTNLHPATTFDGAFTIAVNAAVLHLNTVNGFLDSKRTPGNYAPAQPGNIADAASSWQRPGNNLSTLAAPIMANVNKAYETILNPSALGDVVFNELQRKIALCGNLSTAAVGGGGGGGGLWSNTTRNTGFCYGRYSSRVTINRRQFG